MYKTVVESSLPSYSLPAACARPVRWLASLSMISQEALTGYAGMELDSYGKFIIVRDTKAVRTHPIKLSS